jgi:hypothetical protein
VPPPAEPAWIHGRGYTPANGTFKYPLPMD